MSKQPWAPLLAFVSRFLVENDGFSRFFRPLHAHLGLCKWLPWCCQNWTLMQLLINQLNCHGLFRIDLFDQNKVHASAISSMKHHETHKSTIFALSRWLQRDDDAKDCQEDNWNQPWQKNAMAFQVAAVCFVGGFIKLNKFEMASCLIWKSAMNRTHLEILSKPRPLEFIMAGPMVSRIVHLPTFFSTKEPIAQNAHRSIKVYASVERRNRLPVWNDGRLQHCHVGLVVCRCCCCWLQSLFFVIFVCGHCSLFLVACFECLCVYVLLLHHLTMSITSVLSS